MASAKTEVSPQSDGSLHAKIIGKIDEHFDGKEILSAAAGAKTVVLKLDGVRSISSLGVRALETFMRGLSDRQVFLDDISAAIANQFSMIPNLLVNAQVRSARLPFVCPACGAEQLHSIPYVNGAGATHAPNCPDCKSKMDFDGFSEEYLPNAK
jgi:anti-anti-sigma regulatory factor